MKIGIIVHSFTGNTLSVAERIEDKLRMLGHTAAVEKIGIKGGETKDTAEFELQDPPDVSGYDAIVFGAPVRAFSLSPIMSAYLKQVPSLNGKKAACFVTKQFANKWTGGTGSLNVMKKLCESKGGRVVQTGIVFWSKNRDKMVEDLASSFCEIF